VENTACRDAAGWTAGRDHDLGEGTKTGERFGTSRVKSLTAALPLVALSLANRSLGNAGAVGTISAATDRRYRIVPPKRDPRPLLLGRWALRNCGVNLRQYPLVVIQKLSSHDPPGAML